MNKHSIITAIAIIVIVIPFAYSGLNIVGMQQMEYRWNGPGEFSFFAMSNSGNVELCNTLPFWMSFQKFEVAPFYEKTQLGSFVVGPTTINPLASTVSEGIFRTEEMAMAQHDFMTLDYEFNGGEIRLDPNKFIVVINSETSIIGIIPYSTTTQITGFDFDQMMNADDLTCN